MSDEEFVDIIEKDGILECKIKVPPRNFQFPRTVIFKTDDVVRLLAKKGYAIDQILEHSLVHNKATRNHRYEGTWRFKLKVAPPPKKRTSSTKARTSKTTNSKK